VQGFFIFYIFFRQAGRRLPVFTGFMPGTVYVRKKKMDIKKRFLIDVEGKNGIYKRM
jgi:hypothetical protein